MKEDSTAVFFAPELYIDDVAAAIEFYKKAFGANELRRWSNDDGSVHVAEMAVAGRLFHIHEPVYRVNELSPVTLKGTTVVIGLFLNDPDTMMAQAVAAGATAVSSMTDYEYGYRQGSITDPFGHHWQIQKKNGIRSMDIAKRINGEFVIIHRFTGPGMLIIKYS